MPLVTRTCERCSGSFECKHWAMKRFCSKYCGDHSSKNKRHGLSDNPEHRTWTRIRERCSNPSHGDYARYGGRGILEQARNKRNTYTPDEEQARRPMSEISDIVRELREDYPAVDVTTVVFSRDFAGVGGGSELSLSDQGTTP